MDIILKNAISCLLDIQWSFRSIKKSTPTKPDNFQEESTRPLKTQDMNACAFADIFREKMCKNLGHHINET